MKNNVFFQQVNLCLKHDWDKTIQAAEKIFDLISKKNYLPEVSGYGASDHYDLKDFGVLSIHRPSESWYRLSGPFINKTMPWIDNLLSDLKDLDPDMGAISRLIGDGNGHVDLPSIPSALNYIFKSTDAEAHTWITHDGMTEIYPSDVNSGIILDTQVSHGVKNQGTRWSLSIHFGSDYSTIKQWFDHHKNLIYGI